jgi:hypothetical protein
MDVEETIATINRLGKTVVPAVRAVTPRTTLPEPSELSEGSAG